MLKNLRLIITLSCAFFAFQASGERPLSEREILARCYAQLTGTRLPVRDPLWKKLETKLATEVCTQIIDSVSLGANGLLTDAANPVHRLILRQFNDIHRNWFPHRLTTLNTFPDTYYGTVDVYDADEPAMFITRSLFSQQPKPYRSVLSGFESLYAIRDPSTTHPSRRGLQGFPRPSRVYVGDAALSDQQPIGILDMEAVAGQTPDGQYFPIQVPIVQVGALYGIGVSTDTSSTSNLWVNNFTATATPQDMTLKRPQRFHENYGGGALGSIPFLLTNFGHGFDITSDGSLKIPRKIMFTAMNSFLCQSGPFLRTSDVGQYLALDSDTQAAPFRHGTSCLRCHASMDQSASTMRHLRLGSTINNISVGVTRIAAMVLSTTTDQPAEPIAWATPADPMFHRRPTNGRLLFRSVSGALVNQPVSNMEQLGQAMAATDDYYACAASRYFKYFTGIQVNIFDPSDPSNQSAIANMTEKDREYRNYVLQLGRQLRETESLKTLVKQIMKSNYYKLAQFGR